MTETPPGWYPDPSGVPGSRYWDGAQWTDQVQPPPTPLLPPQPQPGRHRGCKTFLIVVAGVLVALTVAIVGCGALIAGSVDEVQQESDKTAITREQYESVGSGDTLDSVKAEFGEPQDAQDFDVDTDPETEALIGKNAGDSSCIYYGEQGELMTMFQFCFDGDGNYASKAAY